MDRLLGTLPEVLNKLGPSTEVEEAMVFAAWKRCAGGPLSARAVPCEFFENRLVVAVEDNMWRRHLEELCPQLISRINQYLESSTLRFIEFRIDPDFLSANRKPHRDELSEPADVPPNLADAAENIRDPRLRARFLSAASDYLARQRSDK